MDKLSLHHGQNNGISKPPVHHHHGKGGGKGKQGGGGGGGGKGIKVVYISSPMKLTASAEEFRAVVQELTGRDSNVAEHDAEGRGAVPSSSSYSSYPSSFGRVSPTAAAAAGARALPPTMSTADNAAGAGAAMPPSFQSMYDQTGGAGLLDGQEDCVWLSQEDW